MSDDTLYKIYGVIGFIAMISIIIVISRIVGRIANRFTARAMAPLAGAIGGLVDPEVPCITATYQGCILRAFNAPKTSVGHGDAAWTINAFYIEVPNLPGRSSWRLKYFVTGILGQGPKKLYIETSDEALADRLVRSGIVEEVTAVGSPSTVYVTAEYDVRHKTLTFIDDVLPRKLPTRETFLLQAGLAVRLAQVNADTNSPG
jgi:hypothetical protein